MEPLEMLPTRYPTWNRLTATSWLLALDARKGEGVGVLQVLVHERDRHASLADRGRHALHRRVADVAAGEDAGNARLEQVRVAVERPPARGAHVRARENEAAAVERDLGRQPRGLGVRPDEDVEPARLDARRLPRVGIAQVDRLERRLAVAENCDAAGVGREVHRRLAGGVAGADDVDVEAVRVRCLAPGRAVEDALPRKAIEAGNLELPPRDTARENDRAGADDVPSVEVHMACLGVDPGDRAGDEDLGSQAARL